MHISIILDYLTLLTLIYCGNSSLLKVAVKLHKYLRLQPARIPHLTALV